MSLDLLSTTSRVEVPFVLIQIGNVSLGLYDKETREIIANNNGAYKSIIATYPNFIESLQISKINGTINTYTINLKYSITTGDDPNLIEKILSKVSDTRKIYISYGDLSTASYIYRNEEAIISKVKHRTDFASSSISYTITATSSTLLATVNTTGFEARTAKPSDVIKEILYDNKYGLLEIFYGMSNKSQVLLNNLIASDDQVVQLLAQPNMSAINYLEYLVKSMIPYNDNDNDLLQKGFYRIAVVDSTNNLLDGPYFKVVKVSNKTQLDKNNIYVLNVGMPDNNAVMNFNINEDETFSILYNFSKNIEQPNYIQRIDNNGNLINEYSPAISSNNYQLQTQAIDKTWWTNMTSYPISGEITIKGLLKPAILMSYIYLDCRFYGRKYYASGYYIITKQIDSISRDGYRTTLSLQKVLGDDEYGY